MIKTICLGLILVLQATGLWSQLPAESRNRLSQQAVNPQQIAYTTAKPAHVAINGAWPVRLSTTDSLSLPAKAALAVDVGSGTPLYEQNPTTKLPIASITKLVTALVILSSHDLTTRVTIPKLPEYGPEDERIGLAEGETYIVQDLLRALMIQSANDAADALAIINAGSQAQFAAQMNIKMAEWSIEGVRFTGPSGLVDSGNYATAEALSKIARLTLTNSLMRQIMAETTHTITSGAGRIINLQTTNQLLYGSEFYGIKTGYTLAAGECFVGLTRISGHEVVTIVLGTTDRFGTTQTLANWIKRTWQWL